jgi:Spx/MgsR family transcriptional regulator
LIKDGRLQPEGFYNSLGVTRGVSRKISANALPIRSAGIHAYATDRLTTNILQNNCVSLYIYPMKYTVYGISNCNTVKKALDWLKGHQIAYTFHDYKKQRIGPEKVESWLKQAPWEKLVNRAGTTWKQLPEEEKGRIQSSHQALDLMLSKHSVIKRPLIENAKGKIVILGFDEKQYASLFKPDNGNE